PAAARASRSTSLATCPASPGASRSLLPRAREADVLEEDRPLAVVRVPRHEEDEARLPRDSFLALEELAPVLREPDAVLRDLDDDPRLPDEAPDAVLAPGLRPALGVERHERARLPSPQGRPHVLPRRDADPFEGDRVLGLVRVAGSLVEDEREAGAQVAAIHLVVPVDRRRGRE